MKEPLEITDFQIRLVGIDARPEFWQETPFHDDVRLEHVFVQCSETSDECCTTRPPSPAKVVCGCAQGGGALGDLTNSEHSNLHVPSSCTAHITSHKGMTGRCTQMYVLITPGNSSHEPISGWDAVRQSPPLRALISRGFAAKWAPETRSWRYPVFPAPMFREADVGGPDPIHGAGSRPPKSAS